MVFDYRPRKWGAVADQTVELLGKHDWPGNIRELSNVVKKLAILRDESAVISEFRKQPVSTSMVAENKDDLKMMVRGLKDQAELQALDAVLKENNWNRRRAAAQLNISYKALLYKIKQYELRPPAPVIPPLRADGYPNAPLAARAGKTA